MASKPRTPIVVRAAGVLPWRHTKNGGLEVALVHRSRYDDWSWPKGKLDPGEDYATAAARECLEETGMRVRLGVPLPTATYPMDRRGGRPVVKVVRYWSAAPVGGHGRLEHEVDAVRWLRPKAAAARLSYDRDVVQLDELMAAEKIGLLETWPLLLVRHAKAAPRETWHRPDPVRPLNAIGTRRAARLRDILEAYAPTRLLTSPSTRCVDTIKPYAAARGLPLTGKNGLSEEGFAADASRCVRHLQRLLERAEAAALCTHGPLLPDLLHRLAEIAAGSVVSAPLRRLASDNLDKGEALAALVLGAGEGARVVHVERHRPPRDS